MPAEIRTHLEFNGNGVDVVIDNQDVRSGTREASTQANVQLSYGGIIKTGGLVLRDRQNVQTAIAQQADATKIAAGAGQVAVSSFTQPSTPTSGMDTTQLKVRTDVGEMTGPVNIQSGARQLTLSGADRAVLSNQILELPTVQWIAQLDADIHSVTASDVDTGTARGTQLAKAIEAKKAQYVQATLSEIDTLASVSNLNLLRPMSIFR